MATNKEKYQTICNRVVLTRGSWALERFVEDAVNHHMDDQAGKLVALRLTEYYELLDRLNVLPGGLALISPMPEIDGGQQGNGKAPAVRSAAKQRDEEEDEDEQGSTSTPNTNGGIDDAVLDQWG